MKGRLLIALLVLGGCQAKRTEVVAYINNSDLDIGTDVDQISLVVRDRDDGNRIYFSLGHGSDQVGPTPQPLCRAGLTSNCFKLPLSITLYPGSHSNDLVEVEVTAYLGTTPRIDDIATFHFTEGSTQRLDFYLYKSCLGSTCASQGELCGSNGSCQGGGVGGPDGGADLAGVDLARNLGDLAGPAWVAVPPLPMTGVGSVARLAVPAQNNSLLYAAAQAGIFLSTDSGASWVNKNLMPANSLPATLTVDSTNAMNLYVGGNSVQQSMDSGNTWGTLLNMSVQGVALDSTNHWLYAVLGSGGLNYNDGVNGWKALNTGLTSMSIVALGADKSFIYASTGDGKFFQLARGTAGAWTPVSTAPAGIQAMVVDANNDLYVMGAFGGNVSIQKTSDRMTWKPFAAPPVTFYTLVPHPTDASILYANTAMGVYKQVGNGGWFSKNEGLADLDVRSLVIDPVNPDTLYAGTRSSVVYKTVTGAE
jgi:hypothetical protein